MVSGPRRTRGPAANRLIFDQPNVAGARPLLRIFRCEIDALTLAQQLEHRAPHGAAVEEVLNPALVADEPEPLVDQEPCDCPGWHSRTPPVPKSLPALAELENRVSLGKLYRGSQGESVL